MAPSLYGSNDADCDKPVGSGRLRYPSMEESLMGLRTPFPYGLYAGRARSGAALYTRPIYAGIIEGIYGALTGVITIKLHRRRVLYGSYAKIRTTCKGAKIVSIDISRSRRISTTPALFTIITNNDPVSPMASNSRVSISTSDFGDASVI